MLTKLPVGALVEAEACRPATAGRNVFCTLFTGYKSLCAVW